MGVFYPDFCILFGQLSLDKGILYEYGRVFFHVLLNDHALVEHKVL